MIELVNIRKEFKKDFFNKKITALDSVSFQVADGNLVGFLGANGAGKTTTLKLILNFSMPSSGEIIYPESNGGTYQGFVKNLGYLPERPYFHPNLTAREFLNYMGQLNGVVRNELKTRTDYWCKRLGIEYALDRKLKKFSKGMLQRVGFISCLLHNPDYLIFDEPVSGLDPIGRKEIKDVMRELHDNGKTIFFSSHIVSDIEEICDHLIVLDKGRQVFQGKVEDILLRNKVSLCELMINTDSPDAYKVNESYKVVQLGIGYKIIFPLSEKNELIKRALSRNDEVISINDVHPSLEEIIYGDK